MKKSFLILFLAVPFLASGQAVTREIAERISRNHLQKHFSDNMTVQSVVSHYRDSVACFYEVTMSNGAWCFVPATMLVEPILAYGLSPLDTIDMAPAFKMLMEWYKWQIDTIIRSGATRGSVLMMWDNLLNPDRLPTPYQEGTRLLYFVRDKGQRWRQDINNNEGCSPSYNQECPLVNDMTHICVPPEGWFGLPECDCGRKPTGCASVAMGQVMWYWQWPRN